MYSKEQILKNYQPVSVTDSGYLLYRAGKFYIYDRNADKVEFCFRHIKKNIFENFKLCQRLFRTRIRCSYFTKQGNLIYGKDYGLYFGSVRDGEVKKIYAAGENFSTPLNLVKSYFDDRYAAYFGDYGSNRKYEDIHIYGVSESGNCEIVYTFKNMRIRHIHNIVPDEYRKQYYILTGDNEENAGIYVANMDFSQVYPLVTGQQNYRAVAGFATKQGLLYATDSVMERNSIFLLDIDDEHRITKITDMNGSCIYSCRTKQGFYFSTTVESEEGRGYLGLLSNKRGAGILSDMVELISVNDNLECVKVKEYKKDFWPYKLFQYGVVCFASNQEDEESLIYYPCACMKNEGNTVILS